MEQRKLRHIAPDATELEGGELYMVAECAPGTGSNAVDEKGDRHTVIAGCPLVDDYTEDFNRLVDILWLSGLRGLTVVTKRDSCCSSFSRRVREAVASSGNDVRLRHIVVDDEGEVLSSRESLGIGAALGS